MRKNNKKKSKVIDATKELHVPELYRNRLKPRSENQKKAIDTIESNCINFISGPAGSGKTLLAVGSAIEYLLEDKVKKIVITRPIMETGASIGYIPGPQPLDSKILTPRGWKMFGDIKVDDKVISRDGKPTKVIGVYPKGKKYIYKVITSDGRSTECCLDHLWYTYNLKEKKLNKEGNVRTLQEIINDIDNKIKHFIPINEAVHFDKQELLIPPYTLGVLLGDGISDRSHVRFASADKEVVNKVNKEINKLGLFCKKMQNNTKKYKNKASTYTLSSIDNCWEGCQPVKITDLKTNKVLLFQTNKKAIEFVGCNGSTLSTRVFYGATVDEKKYEKYGECWRNPVLSYFKKSGLHKKKAWDKFIPYEYKYSNINDRLEILRGLLDTDGSCRVRKSDQVTFYTTSLTLAKDVMEIVMSLGGKTRLSSRNRIKETENQKIKARRLSYEVVILLPKDMNPFYLKRKADRFLGNDIKFLEIKSIEKTGKLKEVQCIRVDNPEHLYLTDNFIVTHNTAEEKLHPYLLPILDEFHKCLSPATYTTLKTNGKIEIVPLGFMRGRNFHNCFIVADECQNASYDQLKMLLTRIGSNSKMVITGDTAQSDLPYHIRGGFQYIMDSLYGIDGIGVALLENIDIVRNPIIAKILDRLEMLEEKNNESSKQ